MRREALETSGEAHLQDPQNVVMGVVTGVVTALLQ